MLIERTVYLTNRQEINQVLDCLSNRGYPSHEEVCFVDGYRVSTVRISNGYVIHRNGQFRTVFPITITIEIPNSQHETVVDLLLSEYSDHD